MKKIEKLTDAQEAILPRFRAEWFAWGVNTDRAARAKAEAAILAMRSEIGVKTKPESFTDAELQAEKNSEVARAIGERLGWGKFLDRMGAKVIDACELPATCSDGSVVSLKYDLLDLKTRLGPTQPRWLRMQSPPVKDGTSPIYVEKVHPELRTAKAARKWQFRLADGTWPSAEFCNDNPELTFEQEA